jgi:hypothetical protein
MVCLLRFKSKEEKNEDKATKEDRKAGNKEIKHDIKRY